MDAAPITQALTVTSNTTKPFQVLLEPSDGLAPLTATLTIRNRQNVNFTRITVDTTGDAAPDATLTSLTNGEAVLTIPYANPGTYEVVVKAYGPGEVLLYQATRRVLVVDPRDVANRVHITYMTMVNRLRANDATAALRAFTGSAQAKFSGIFSSLGAGIAQAATQLGTPKSLSIMGGLAEITLIRPTANGSAAFSVQFVQGEDGVWRIEEM